MTMTARPTMYEGRQMRSRLEARVAAFFDSLDFEWEYEPRAYGTRAGQYLPDFEIRNVPTPLVWGAPTGRLYVDVKGELSASLHLQLQTRMERILVSEPTAQLAYSTAAGMEKGNWIVRWGPPVDAWWVALLLRCTGGCGASLFCPLSFTEPSVQSVVLVGCPCGERRFLDEAVFDERYRESLLLLPKYDE